MPVHSVFYKKIKAKNSLYYWFCGLCGLLIAANILSSQRYNQTMYSVMEGETTGAVTYLKHIWGTPLFTLEAKTYQNEGREDILVQWQSIQEENKKRIENLKKASQLHPYSPEIYYNLHLLYSENGEKENAGVNLRKAQAIDPSLK